MRFDEMFISSNRAINDSLIIFIFVYIKCNFGPTDLDLTYTAIAM